MVSQLIFALLALLISVEAFDPPHPCYRYSSKVSKLATCSTKSQFCSSYLGNHPASFVRTITTTKTVLGPKASTTVYASDAQKSTPFSYRSSHDLHLMLTNHRTSQETSLITTTSTVTASTVTSNVQATVQLTYVAPHFWVAIIHED